MHLIKYNTQDVSKAQQLAYWNDAICDTFTHLRCERMDGSTSLNDGFSASIECCDIDQFKLSKVTSDASRVSHTQPHVSQANSEVVLLHLQTVGRSKNSQGNNDVVLESGDFTLCRNTSPYSLEIDNYHEMMVARIPIERLKRYANPDKIPAGFKFKRSDPFNKILGDHLIQIWKARELGLTSQQVSGLSETALSLLGTLLNTNTNEEALSKRQAGHLAVVKNYITDNLHRSELSMVEIAHHAGVTQRYIRQLFQLEGMSCSQFILSQRLKLTAHCLTLPSYQSDRIIDLALNSGFNSIEHFNRSFKKQYGLSPAQYRKHYLG